MIYKQCILTINGNNAKLDEDIYLFRLDKNIELYFTIVNNKYKFNKSDLNNIINLTNASYFQMRLYKNAEVKYTFAIQPTDNEKAILTITDDLIDEPIEVGDYDFQISLLDADKSSMISLPIVSKQIHVCEPLVTDASETGTAVLGLSTLESGEIVDAFDEEGNYIRKVHVNGELISAELFNKWEEALETNSSNIKTLDSQFKENQINLIEDDTSMEGISDSVHDNLTTTNKKIIPAINEINSFLEDNIISIKVYNNDLKSAILNSNKKQIIDLRNKKITYSNSEDILIDSRILANGIIEVTGGAKIILKNENSILHNLKIINKCESNGLNNGIIELLNTTDAIISNVEMELSTKYSGIFCKTRAKNTRINNLKINGNLRYGILFNDSCTEQGATFRIVDGVDYSDATIGSGLYINNYIYKNTVSADDNTYDGDGIELNCPDYGFSDVRINNADIDNARHIGGASGMALGFANCKNMSFYNINSRNCGFDGIHFENKCENVYVYNLYINECSRGINIGSCKNINIINAVVDNCTIWLAMSNLHSNNEEIKLQNVVFDSNKVINSSVASQMKGFEINDMKNSIFRDIFITNSGATGYGFLNLGLSKYLTESNTNSNGYIDIQGCTFENIRIKAGTHTITNPRKIMILGDNSKGNIFKNIKLEGYNAEDLMDFSSNKKYKFENYLVDYEFINISDIVLINILNVNNYVNFVINTDGSITESAENYTFKISIENGKRYGLFRLDGNNNVISWTPRISITDENGTVLDKYISTTNDITINNENAKYMYVFNPGWNLNNFATAMVLKNYKGSSPVNYIECQTNL